MLAFFDFETANAFNLSFPGGRFTFGSVLRDSPGPTSGDGAFFAAGGAFTAGAPPAPVPTCYFASFGGVSFFGGASFFAGGAFFAAAFFAAAFFAASFFAIADWLFVDGR